MGRKLLECADTGIHPVIRWVWMQINHGNMTHKQVAEASGIGANTMRKWFRGESSPKLADIEAVVNALGFEFGVAPIINANKTPNPS